MANEYCPCCYVGNDVLNRPARCWSFYLPWQMRCSYEHGHMGLHMNIADFPDWMIKTTWNTGDAEAMVACPVCGMTREKFFGDDS